MKASFDPNRQVRMTVVFREHVLQTVHGSAGCKSIDFTIRKARTKPSNSVMIVFARLSTLVAYFLYTGSPLEIRSRRNHLVIEILLFSVWCVARVDVDVAMPTHQVKKMEWSKLTW